MMRLKYEKNKNCFHPYRHHNTYFCQYANRRMGSRILVRLRANLQFMRFHYFCKERT